MSLAKGENMANSLAKPQRLRQNFAKRKKTMPSQP